MKERVQIEEILAKVVKEPNADIMFAQMQRVHLELLLDIRDILTQIRAQTREIIISHVPPDYGREDKLV